MGHLPRLYAIADRETLDRRGIALQIFAEELRDAGVRLLQYRDKVSGPQEVLRACETISSVYSGIEATLILNDRADLAALAGWGVHVGQGDLAVAYVRKIIRSGNSSLVGLSTHSQGQVAIADATSADYLAIGPVFATATKPDAEPVVGLDGVRHARARTRKPLVAIGGITHTNARHVMKAGADSIAVIGALLPAEGKTTRQQAEELLLLLGGD